METPVAAADLAPRWSAWLLERNRSGTRLVLWIGITLYPLFGVLDYLVGPREWLGVLWGTRAVVAAATIVLFRLLPRPIFARFPNALSAGYLILGSFGISLMTVFMGGLASPYYAGLSLIIVATGLLFVWPPHVVLTTHATIVLSFIVPNAILHPGPELAAISNLFFLVSTAIIISVGQLLAYRTQRDQLENQLLIERTKNDLEHAHAELKQLDRFKSQFFANITHELKTPLAMILSPLELLLEGKLGKVADAQKTTLQSMFRSGMKLLRLIGDLLDLSKLEESRLRLRVEEVDLVAYLRGLVAQVSPLAARKQITMRFEPTSEVAMVFCDLERVERVFVNLLSNATKFTQPLGTVVVRAIDERDALVVEVEDDGPGFPPEMADRVFERFFQIDMAGTRKHGGTGIGLALAKELVELHGGTITARGAPGEGACFRVRLLKDRDHFPPTSIDRRARASDVSSGRREGDRGVDVLFQEGTREAFRLLDIDEATDQRVVERDADEAARAHTVLVVEDSREVVRVVHLALRQDYRIFAAPDGLKGLELARKHLPSLVVTDLMMPGIDGLELTRRLRADARTRHIPIVMLTARGDLEDRVAGLETGVNAYLAKPFSPRELLTTVRSLLDTQESAADMLLSGRMDSLESIAGGLAHEINNALNYVKNAMGMVRRYTDQIAAIARSPEAASIDPALRARIDALAKKTATMFETADSGARRIANTVELMGRYSREGYSRALQPYDAFAAARDVLALVVPATGREVRVETSFEGDGTVECVPEELNQVLTNLVQNAVEATPEGEAPVVFVRGAGDEDAVAIAVRDEGAGIAPDDRAKIFTPFYTTKGPGKGLGMGLTITRRVVQSLGGTIAVTSEVGKGTEFSVRLPRRGKGARG